MHPDKVAFLEAAGIRQTSEAEFLKISPEQEAVVETKVRLSALLRRMRRARNMTQSALAERIKAPQQTVARLENGHKSVTIDLLMRALLAAGATLSEISAEIEKGANALARETKASAQAEALTDIKPATEVESTIIQPLEKVLPYLPSAADLSLQSRISFQFTTVGTPQKAVLPLASRTVGAGAPVSLCGEEEEDTLLLPPYQMA